MVFSIHSFDFWRIILSTDINSEESRIMFRRKIGTRKATSLEIVADRVSHVAPFFRRDPDPYIVVGDDGQLWWIVDLYLTSDHYPNAKTYIDQTTLMETYSEPKFDRYNYIRNPAVAVINAYSGKINFYFTKETTEPISLSYEKAFATDDGRSLFKPLQEMPAGLQNHLRYPDYLTRVQAEIYKDSWEKPEIFHWLQNAGNIEESEMLKTFNCGIGMILVVNPKETNNLLNKLKELGEEPSLIGKITHNENSGTHVIYK